MSRQVPYMVVLLAAALCVVSIAQEKSIIIGAGKRLVDIELRDTVLRLIQRRVDAGVSVEPLLIFSPFSDPDVLGSIAIDADLALPLREIAANAILDQLYMANPYFQAAAAYYLDILIRSTERSLRLKGWVGGAVIEYRLFSFDAGEEDRRLVLLQYSASRETDPRLRQLLDELNEGDPSALISGAAWSDEQAADKPYRRFDVIQLFPTNGEEEGKPWLIEAWERYRRIRMLLDTFMPAESAPGTLASAASATTDTTGGKAGDAIKTLGNPDIIGLLSRFAAMAPMHGGAAALPDAMVATFRQMARKNPDPYLRALALAPLRFAPDEVAIEESVESLRTDQSPLVRLAGAEALSGYTSDREVRSRMIAVCRMEEDARVRLHILHSLVAHDPANLPPDVQAFLLSRLREEENAEVLAYVVHALGTARLRSAAGLFSRMLTTSSDPVLRARLAEALARLGQGKRLRSLEIPRQ